MPEKYQRSTLTPMCSSSQPHLDQPAVSELKKEKSENIRAIRKLRDILSPIIESEEK